MTHFNEAARTWDSPDKVKRAEDFAALIKKTIPLISPIRVMDIGCGTGLLGYHFAPLAQEILGIDTSEGMLKEFERKAKLVPGAHALNLDLEKEELHTESKFDLVVSSLAFHHLTHPGALLKKLKPHLSHSGKIAIIDLEKENGSFHSSPAEQGVKHFGFSREELQNFAREAKLKLFSCETIYQIEKHGGIFPVFLAVYSAE